MGILKWIAHLEKTVLKKEVHLIKSIFNLFRLKKTKGRYKNKEIRKSKKMDEKGKVKSVEQKINERVAPPVPPRKKQNINRVDLAIDLGEVQSVEQKSQVVTQKPIEKETNIQKDELSAIADTFMEYYKTHGFGKNSELRDLVRDFLIIDFSVNGGSKDKANFILELTKQSENEVITNAMEDGTEQSKNEVITNAMENYLEDGTELGMEFTQEEIENWLTNARDFATDLKQEIYLKNNKERLAEELAEELLQNDKKVKQSATKNSDLLEDIKRGVKLKKVQKQENPVKKVKDESLLGEALSEYFEALGGDDEDFEIEGSSAEDIKNHYNGLDEREKDDFLKEVKDFLDDYDPFDSEENEKWQTEVTKWVNKEENSLKNKLQKDLKKASEINEQASKAINEKRTEELTKQNKEKQNNLQIDSEENEKWQTEVTKWVNKEENSLKNKLQKDLNKASEINEQASKAISEKRTEELTKQNKEKQSNLQKSDSEITLVDLSEKEIEVQ